jgi:hypothetical protein
MKMTSQSINDMRNSTMVNTQAISKLEMQVGQLASHLGERDKGKLPSQPVNNPKACTIGNSSTQEHAHAIVMQRDLVGCNEEQQITQRICNSKS